MFPADIEKKTGFDAVREMLMANCLSPMGKNMAGRLSFSTHLPSLNLWLEQASEFRRLLEEEDTFPGQHYHDLGTVIQKLGVEGLYLDGYELLKVLEVIGLMERILGYFNKRKNKFPALEQLFQDLKVNKRIIQLISPVIDQKGEVKSSASPALQKLTEAVSKADLSIHKQLNAIFKHAKDSGWAGETGLSVREGRLVMPILAEHKRKIRGLVHDASASGSVLYMEPEEIVEANNNLRYLIFERKREIERILRATSESLRPFVTDIESCFNNISLTDFIRAKGLLALQLNAQKPILSGEPVVHLIKAFHPHLHILLSKQHKKTETLDLELNRKNRIMVISGPNAGGKSVALKTIAVNQYMVQCGLLVCAAAESRFTVFKNIMVDIGDGQSIDNNLSSYSAHLRAMKYFIQHAGKHSLFFIDELGSGTDPQFGGAIGEAVLDQLNERGAFGVVTTHFSNIKNFAGQTEGFINGSMLYDKVHFKPLYTLISGKPGSSFALELAKQTGLPAAILEKARAKAGKDENRMEEMLSSFEKDAQFLRIKEKRVREREQNLEKLISDYTELKNKLKEQKESILNKAKAEARTILDQSNRLIEQTIREIRASQADPVQTKKLRASVSEEKNKLSREEENKPESHKPEKEPIKEPVNLQPGDLVKVPGVDTPGKILQVGKEKVLVELGLIKTRLNLDQVQVLDPSGVKTTKKGSAYINPAGYRDEFTPRIDVRGLSGEEALKKTIEMVDRALILNMDKIWILHGKGDGVLRKILRENLKKITHVKSMENEHIDFGGDGITIVNLG